jgi:hypothetical protein
MRILIAGGITIGRGWQWFLLGIVVVIVLQWLRWWSINRT